MVNVFNEILAKAQHEDMLDAHSKKSRKWIREEASKADIEDSQKSVRPMAVQHGKSFVRMGRLYLFRYSPANHATLPYYDTLPVVFPFSFTESGFTGINLHYLPHDLRAILMDRLYPLVNNDAFDDSTYLKKLTYEILNSTARFKYFRPCIKQYLNNRTTSRFIYIPPSQWELALFLPLEKFKKAPKTRVHQDSRRIIRNIR